MTKTLLEKCRSWPDAVDEPVKEAVRADVRAYLASREVADAAIATASAAADETGRGRSRQAFPKPRLWLHGRTGAVLLCGSGGLFSGEGG